MKMIGFTNGGAVVVEMNKREVDLLNAICGALPAQEQMLAACGRKPDRIPEKDGSRKDAKVAKPKASPRAQKPLARRVPTGKCVICGVKIPPGCKYCDKKECEQERRRIQNKKYRAQVAKTKVPACPEKCRRASPLPDRNRLEVLREADARLRTKREMERTDPVEA